MQFITLRFDPETACVFSLSLRQTAGVRGKSALELFHALFHSY